MTGPRRKIRVVIVDDSALIRGLLTDIVNSQEDMEVAGAAADPLVARELIRAERPDVITLDVEMPRMDGLEFLEKLMRLRPTPVLMVSSLTEKGSETTLRALELGAVDFVTKPKLDIARGMREYVEEIGEKIRVAARARVRKLDAAPARQLPHVGSRRASTEKLLVIGASTGGTEAIKDILVALPPDCPGVLIAQHMPEGFTKSFAQRLDSLSRLRVKEADDQERVLPGHAYIAPGHSHLLLKRSGANYVATLSQSAPVNRHRPSVDVLFRSVAEHAGRNAIGIILTGMGKDGALGMLEMHRSGSYNLAQNEESCVVFGMPREAIAAGGVDEVVPLDDIPARVLRRLADMGKGAVRV
jgi:two-component system chemotaxis response regulator CheB